MLYASECFARYRGHAPADELEITMSQHDECNPVCPNFFDVLVHPELILPIMFSHLLSPQFWQVHTKALTRSAPQQSADTSIPDELLILKYKIDNSFEHVHPERIAELYGYVSIDDERSRLDSKLVDAATDRLIRAVMYRKAISPDYSLWLLDQISTGLFPNYVYPCMDVIQAHREFARYQRARIIGSTSCLDEMSIFCAGALTLPKGFVSNICILAGASHYTVVIWDSNHNGYWYPGKRHLFSKQTWQSYVNEHYEQDPRRAYQSFLFECNRVITMRGTFNFDSGISEVPRWILDEIHDDIKELLGYVPPEFTESLQRDIHFVPELPYYDVVQRFTGMSSRDSALEFVREAAMDQQAWAQDVLLAYRSVDVLQHEKFLRAARQGVLYKPIAQSFETPLDAFQFVASIESRTSPLQDRNRIALPDEVVRLRRGSDRDMALLLQVLLEEYARCNALSTSVQSAYGADESVVVYDTYIFSTVQMCLLDELPAGLTITLQ